MIQYDIRRFYEEIIIKKLYKIMTISVKNSPKGSSG